MHAIWRLRELKGRLPEVKNTSERRLVSGYGVTTIPAEPMMLDSGEFFIAPAQPVDSSSGNGHPDYRH